MAYVGIKRPIVDGNLLGPLSLLRLRVYCINQMLDNIGLDVVVNVFDHRTGKIWGNQYNGTKQVIMLYLSPGHFELLEEQPSSHYSNIQLDFKE